MRINHDSTFKCTCTCLCSVNFSGQSREELVQRSHSPGCIDLPYSCTSPTVNITYTNNIQEIKSVEDVFLHLLKFYYYKSRSKSVFIMDSDSAKESNLEPLYP